MEDHDDTSLSIVVLAYDEEDNVGPVLGELSAWLDAHEPDAEILFVDDGSRDRTAERAAAALAGRRHQILRHDRNRGMGAGLKTAVAASRATWITFLPADGQIPPDAIGTLRAAAGPDVDVVLSVYDHRDDGLHRKVLSFGVRSLILAVHGVRLRSDGPYLFRRRLFLPSELPPDTFFLNFEFPIRVLAAGLAVRTVTIACRPRLAGRSKTAAARTVLYVAKDLLEMRSRTLRAWLTRQTGR